MHGLMREGRVKPALYSTGFCTKTKEVLAGTKTKEVLAGMGLKLGKSEKALAELREKGLAPK